MRASRSTTTTSRRAMTSTCTCTRARPRGLERQRHVAGDRQPDQPGGRRIHRVRPRLADRQRRTTSYNLFTWALGSASAGNMTVTRAVVRDHGGGTGDDRPDLQPASRPARATWARSTTRTASTDRSRRSSTRRRRRGSLPSWTNEGPADAGPSSFRVSRLQRCQAGDAGRSSSSGCLELRRSSPPPTATSAPRSTTRSASPPSSRSG